MLPKETHVFACYQQCAYNKLETAFDICVFGRNVFFTRSLSFSLFPMSYSLITCAKVHLIHHFSYTFEFGGKRILNFMVKKLKKKILVSCVEQMKYCDQISSVDFLFQFIWQCGSTNSSAMTTWVRCVCVLWIPKQNTWTLKICLRNFLYLLANHIGESFGLHQKCFDCKYCFIWQSFTILVGRCAI